MSGPMIACPSCAEYVLVRDAACPHCGATVRSGGQVLGRTAGAVLMGLSLAGCPAGDDTTETTVGNGGSSSSSSSMGSTMGSTTDEGTTSFDVSSGPVGEAYGVPDTESFGSDPTDSSSTGGDTEGDTDTDTDGTTGGSSGSSSTGLGPDYGVPTTGE